MSGSIRRLANLQRQQLYHHPIHVTCLPWSRFAQSYSSLPSHNTYTTTTTTIKATDSNTASIHRDESLPAKVIFSGIQPTGVPHLGNYLGALRHWVELQNRAADADRLLYAVVDLHAITAAAADPSALRKWRREMLAALLAIGLDPDRCTLFYQSAVMSPPGFAPCRLLLILFLIRKECLIRISLFVAPTVSLSEKRRSYEGSKILFLGVNV